MAKVFIGVGHGGDDPGAVGYLVEKEINLVEALACRDFLQAHGVEVSMSRTTAENDPVMAEIEKCNAFETDLSVDIHNSSDGGKGFEAYYHYKGGISQTLTENIKAEVKEIGQTSRDCKTRLNSSGRDYYAFIRETICPTVICEGCFVDNAEDVKIADTPEKQKAFGIAYAKGSREPRHANRARKTVKNLTCMPAIFTF